MASAKRDRETIAQRWQSYRPNSPAFLYDVFGVDTLAPWQEKGLWSVANHQRTAFAGAQGTGKGFVIAGALLHHAGCYEKSKGAVLSATKAQLKTNVWSEIASLYSRSDAFQRMFELNTSALVSRSDPLTWFVVARAAAARGSAEAGDSTKVSEAAAGMYAEHTLTALDECSGLDDAVCDAVEGTASTKWRKLLYASNPLRRYGRFAAIYLLKGFGKGWVRFNISKEDSPWTNTPEARAIWLNDVEKFGINSAYVQARIFGRFPKRGTIDTIISEEDVLLAYERVFPTGPDDLLVPIDIGIDPARMGDDLCTFFVRRGRTILDAVALPYTKIPGIVRVAKQLAVKWCGYNLDGRGNRIKADPKENTTFRIDESGLGGGVVDDLQDEGWYVLGVDNGRTPPDFRAAKTYANLGMAVWSNGAERLKECSLHRVPEKLRTLLTSQLASRQYGFTTGNGPQKMGLLSKARMRQLRLGSPDLADALMLCICDLDVLGVAGSIEETIAVM